MQPKPLPRDDDLVPMVPDEVESEITRITGMKPYLPPFGHELAMLVNTLWVGSLGVGGSRPPRWTSKTRAELAELREMLQRVRAQIEKLSPDSRAFLGWRPDYPDWPLQGILRNTIECIQALEEAATAVETKIDALEIELRTKRGDYSKAANEDSLGEFYEFVECLASDILARGGRITVDKNFGGGTLVAVLRLLKPYFPPDTVLPGFMTIDGSTQGLARLDRVRQDIKQHHAPRAARRACQSAGIRRGMT